MFHPSPPKPSTLNPNPLDSKAAEITHRHPQCYSSKAALPLKAGLSIEACTQGPDMNPAQKKRLPVLRGNPAASLQVRCLKADLPLPTPRHTTTLQVSHLKATCHSWAWPLPARSCHWHPRCLWTCWALRPTQGSSLMQQPTGGQQFKSQQLSLLSHLANGSTAHRSCSMLCPDAEATSTALHASAT